MIIDSSAILAIAFLEPEAEGFAAAIVDAPVRLMSSVTWFETLMVVEARHGEDAADNVIALLRELRVEMIPFDSLQMQEARAAWQRFGKGRHPAALNMGDCCAYAAASLRGEPLLFKGNDFNLTDVTPAAW